MVNFRVFGQYLITGVEILAAVTIGFGAFLTFWRTAQILLGRVEYTFVQVRLSLTRYLLLGLEFALGADIIATALGPSFTEIGRLAAIAAIRTSLNYFLTKEMEREAKEAGKIKLKV